ncbi:hypothetical protein F183_A43700 [Bryobacterales bacterium F-183]|nr:hypothetical protein F183_A43700 [Bryobacterales bacterium F-183]
MHEAPGPLELKCLQAIWKLGEANVKDVRDILTKDRKLAYTTVMTTLDRLEKKGTLKRHKSGKAFVYQAAMTEDEIRRMAVQHLLDEYFDGSVDRLQSYLGNAGRTASPRPLKIDTTLL